MVLEAGFYKRHIEALERGPLKWPREDLYMTSLEILGDGGMVVLLGKRGTGKTQMAACLAAACAMVRGLRPFYLRLSDYFGAIKRTFDGTETRDPRVRCRCAPFLVLDECQERYESAFEDLELTRLIDARYGNRLATVLIANLKPEELGNGLGPSVVSRIQECGVVVECNWSSFRERIMNDRKGDAA